MPPRNYNPLNDTDNKPQKARQLYIDLIDVSNPKNKKASRKFLNIKYEDKRNSL